jgi:hypothetical protein
LSVKATTGSDVEILETVTARQLFVKLTTGSQFYGGPKLQATAARVDVTTGGDANVRRSLSDRQSNHWRHGPRLEYGNG